jgi:hypothetical protein
MAVAVSVLHEREEIGKPFDKLFVIQIKAGRFGDVESAPVIEASEHGMLDHRRSGDALDNEPGRDSERQSAGR